MDKDKIQNIAEELADSMYGKDFYDLSGRQQSEIYSKAIRELNDMLADKADMMRKGEADGGIIRAGFANGTMMASAPDIQDELARALAEDGSASSTFITPKAYYPGT